MEVTIHYNGQAVAVEVTLDINAKIRVSQQRGKRS